MKNDKTLTKEAVLALDGQTLIALTAPHNIDCTDCVKSTQCAYCTRCDYCFGCVNSKKLVCCTLCHDCESCLSCVECVNCQDCICCDGQQNAKFKVFNVQLTAEEFASIVERMEEAWDSIPKAMPTTTSQKAN